MTWNRVLLASMIENHIRSVMAHAKATLDRNTGGEFGLRTEGDRIVTDNPAAMIAEYGTNTMRSRPWALSGLADAAGGAGGDH